MTLTLSLALALTPGLPAGDDFKRERDLSALEGKPAPELHVEGWRNADGFDLGALRGKVVVLDFWGTW